METEKFWFVWCKDGNAPTYKHTSEMSAKYEAERLAKANRGKEFVVLEATSSVVVTDVHWKELNHEVPF